jgi:hypothetical protein
LIDFFSPSELTESVCELLEDAPRRAHLGGQARAFAQTHYDLASVCLPRQLEWVEALAAVRTLSSGAAKPPPAV